MKKQLISGIALSLFSTLVFSHPGHGLATAYAGFLHPFTGWDHLLVMIAVGLWAAKIGGHARWALPATFLLSMSVGALMAFNGIGFAGAESVIAASVIAMGLLLLVQLPINLGVRVGITALFALFHGMAHGMELMGQGRFTILLGMLVATALLHGIGLVFGTQKWLYTQKLNNLFAYALMMFGTFSLI
jgi:urease accessory protein